MDETETLKPPLPTALKGSVEAIPPIFDERTRAYKPESLRNIEQMTFAERVTAIYKTTEELYGNETAEEVNNLVREASSRGEVKTDSEGFMSSDLYVGLGLSDLKAVWGDMTEEERINSKELLLRDLSLLATFANYENYQNPTGEAMPQAVKEVVDSVLRGRNDPNLKPSLKIRNYGGSVSGLTLAFKDLDQGSQNDPDGFRSLQSEIYIGTNLDHFGSRTPHNTEFAMGYVGFYGAKEKLVMDVYYQNYGRTKDDQLALEKLRIDCDFDNNFDFEVSFDKNGQLKSVTLPKDFSPEGDQNRRSNWDQDGFVHDIDASNSDSVIASLNRMFSEKFGVEGAYDKINSLRVGSKMPQVMQILKETFTKLKNGEKLNSSQIMQGVVSN